MKQIDYQTEKENNERIFSELLQKIRPDIWVLMDTIDQTGVNPFVLYKVIRQINNIAIGSGWGEVTVLLNDKRVVRVAGQDTEKVNEPALIKRNP